MYLKNLNGLRFLAATSVIITHIEQAKELSGIPSSIKPPIIGGLGVILFFVISGFLITYLLLDENKRCTTISIKKFFLRRILRIWPLYFFIVILAAFVLPHFDMFHVKGYSDRLYDHFGMKLFFYFFLIPNFGALVGSLPLVSHLWSIGVEEQFYIMWPFIVKKFKNLIVVFIMIFIVTLAAIMFVNNFDFLLKKLPLRYDAIRFLITNLRFDAMAIGGILALLTYRKNAFFMKVLQSKVIEIINIGIIITLIIFNIFSEYAIILYSILFTILIGSAVFNEKSIINLEHPVISYLGKVSYGIYMYHLIAISIVMYISGQMHFHSTFYLNAFLYSTSISISFALAILSYQFLEMPFLKMKQKQSTCSGTLIYPTVPDKISTK